MPGFSLKVMVLGSTCSIASRFAPDEAVENAPHDVVFGRGLAEGWIQNLNFGVGASLQNARSLRSNERRKREAGQPRRGHGVQKLSARHERCFDHCRGSLMRPLAEAVFFF